MRRRRGSWSSGRWVKGAAGGLDRPGNRVEISGRCVSDSPGGSFDLRVRGTPPLRAGRVCSTDSSGSGDASGADSRAAPRGGWESWNARLGCGGSGWVRRSAGRLSTSSRCPSSGRGSPPASRPWSSPRPPPPAAVETEAGSGPGTRRRLRRRVGRTIRIRYGGRALRDGAVDVGRDAGVPCRARPSCRRELYVVRGTRAAGLAGAAGVDGRPRRGLRHDVGQHHREHVVHSPSRSAP